MPKNNTSYNKTLAIGSLYQWALASFVIVTLPLVFAIIFTVIEVTDYTQKSQQTLFQSVNSTESSRLILARLISMERSIRQFQVLNEAELFTTYQEHRNKFLTILDALKSKGLDQDLTKNLNLLSQNEKLLHQNILTKTVPPSSSTTSARAKDQLLSLSSSDLDGFDQLTRQARILLEKGERRLSTEASNLSIIATRVRERLVYSALVSIPLALLLGITFVNLLTRPIKDIGQAIRNLGEKGFEQSISIKGPQDLTDLGLHLEWLRQKLNRLEHDKQQFIRNISHELKTPLATLKEGTDLLSENVVGELNTEQQEIIQLMQLGNITIYNLVENLLEYQRAISSKLDFNVSTFELRSLINRVVDDYQLPLLSKNITLLSNLSPISINADYEKLKIIISNVFSNALKFSPKNGTINLSLSIHGNVIQLKIEDQGPGIDKKQQPFIFNDFYQGNSPQSWKIKGSGLGLALVKHYLIIHKGSIKLLKSNQQYCGARFSLLLPQNMRTIDASIN